MKMGTNKGKPEEEKHFHDLATLPELWCVGCSVRSRNKGGEVGGVWPFGLPGPCCSKTATSTCVRPF